MKTGKRYPLLKKDSVIGKWTVTADESPGASDRIRVRCECGFEAERPAWRLHSGGSTKCRRCKGVTQPELAERKKGVCPDRAHRERLWWRINAIIKRCTNPTAWDYKHYGARGVTVHQPWLADRVSFLAHLVSLPGWDDANLEIDRADNNGNYEPGNLRFVTSSVNKKNRRPRN
jgi:hypothetical protein